MDCSQNKNFLDSEIAAAKSTQTSRHCSLNKVIAATILISLSQTTGPLMKYSFLKWQWIFFYPKQLSFLYNTDNNFTGHDYLSSTAGVL
jgi:hypothetical protein